MNDERGKHLSRSLIAALLLFCCDGGTEASTPTVDAGGMADGADAFVLSIEIFRGSLTR
jgi:hypothetical protein